MFFPESFKMEETFFHFFPFLYHPQDYSSTAPLLNFFYAMRSALCFFTPHVLTPYVSYFAPCPLPIAPFALRHALCALRLLLPVPLFYRISLFQKIWYIKF